MESPDEAFTFSTCSLMSGHYREDDGELVIEKIKEKSDKRLNRLKIS